MAGGGAAIEVQTTPYCRNHIFPQFAMQKRPVMSAVYSADAADGQCLSAFCLTHKAGKTMATRAVTNVLYRGILLKQNAALEMLPLVVYVCNLCLSFFKLTEGCYQMTNTPPYTGNSRHNADMVY